MQSILCIKDRWMNGVTIREGQLSLVCGDWVFQTVQSQIAATQGFPTRAPSKLLLFNTKLGSKSTLQLRAELCTAG